MPPFHKAAVRTYYDLMTMMTGKMLDGGRANVTTSATKRHSIPLGHGQTNGRVRCRSGRQLAEINQLAQFPFLLYFIKKTCESFLRLLAQCTPRLMM